MSRFSALLLALPLAAGAASYPMEGGGPARAHSALQPSGLSAQLKTRWSKALKPTETTAGQLVTIGGVTGYTQVPIANYGAALGHPVLSSSLLLQSFDTGIMATRRDNGAQVWDEFVACNYNGATPVFDEAQNLLYVPRLHGTVYAHRLSDGDSLFAYDDRAAGLSFTTRCSPLLIDGKLLIDRGGSGLSAFDTASRNFLWRNEFEQRQACLSPAYLQGRILVGGSLGLLRAIDPGDGHTLWSLDTGKPWVGSVAASGELFYVHASDGSLEARRISDGGLVWSKIGVATADSALAGELILVPGPDRILRAFSQSDGGLIWSRSFTAALSHAPLQACGVVYVDDASGTYHALDGKSGEIRWSQKLGANGIGSGWAEADGQLFILDSLARLHALEAASPSLVCDEQLPAVTVTFSHTATVTATPSATKTSTLTRTWTASKTATITRTFSASPSSSVTPTVSATRSASPSATPSPTSSPSSSHSPTSSATPTQSPSFTPSPTNAPTKDFQVTPQSTPPWKGSPQVKTSLASPNPLSNSGARKIQVELPGGADQVEIQIFSSAYSPEARWTTSFPLSSGDWISVDFPPDLRLAQGLHYFKLTAKRGGLSAVKNGRVMVLD